MHHHSQLPFLLFSGPCQIESLSHCLRVAETLKELVADVPDILLVFKSSFDKANRTSLTSSRGVGIKTGLDILGEIKRLTNLPIITDIHDPSQARVVAEIADIIQIPAFLCRQTDLLLAAGETGKPIHIKKGQFLNPADMEFAAQKIASTGNNKILLCERGTCFGYNDLIVDFRSLLKMQQLGYPVVMDATHSCMSMGGAEGKSGGDRDFALSYLKAALAIGCQGAFIECHNEPEKAPSDAATMLPLDDMAHAIAIIRTMRAQTGLIATGTEKLLPGSIRHRIQLSLEDTINSLVAAQQQSTAA